MREKKLNYVYSLAIILNGLICIFYNEQIYGWLPTICGMVLLIMGTIRMIEGIQEKDYASLEGIKFESSIVYLAMAIGILIKQSDALFIVGVFWGLKGLKKATNYLNHALYNFSKKEKFAVTLVKAIVEFTLSILLIFDPFSKLAEHIIILGIELIFEGVIDLISSYKNEKIEE